MQLEALKTFVSLAETKSYSQTGRQSFLSAGQTHKRIRTLEESLKHNLVTRCQGSHFRIELTENGRRFLPYAKKALDILNQGQEVLKG